MNPSIRLVDPIRQNILCLLHQVVASIGMISPQRWRMLPCSILKISMLETVFRLAMHFDLRQNLRCHRQAFLSLESLLSGYGTRIRSYGALSKSIHSTGHSLLWPYPYPLY